MRIYKLTTNEGERYVRSTDERLRKAMHQYIQAKRAEGKSLSDIMFTWTPLTVGTI